MQGLHPKPYLGRAKFLSVAPVAMCQQSFSVRAKVLTAVLPKNQVCWDVILCRWASGSQHFNVTKCLHIQDSNTKTNTIFWAAWPFSFRISGTTHTVTQHHIPEHLNIHPPSLSHMLLTDEACLACDGTMTFHNQYLWTATKGRSARTWFTFMGVGMRHNCKTPGIL